MKPSCRRILFTYKRSSFYGLQIPICNSSPVSKPRRIYSCNSIGNSVGLFRRGVIGSNQTGFCCSDSGLCRQPRVLLNGCQYRKFSRLVSKVASDYRNSRNHSTSVESHVNDTSWELIYIQGGLNVKPLVEKKDDTLLDFSRADVNKEADDRKETEIEKEAWKLLRGSIVNYCGSPVGTIAATDPADKMPLNYDQVFIRDFVPSALAFLLNGEGEIVKNFLLHTLQLQVISCLVTCCFLYDSVTSFL